MAGRNTREYPVLTYCPYGHALAAGRALYGWTFCQCAPALARHRGHSTVRCLACEDVGRRTIAYDPPHVRTAEEIEAERSTLLASLQRIRGGLADWPPGPHHDELAARADRFEQGVNELAALAEVYRRREAGKADT